MSAKIKSRCLFCLKTDVPFKRREHPIPESLRNDDLILEPGLVCDLCNQYFGAKVEQKVLSAPPFSIEKAGAAVKSKKGKMPMVKVNDDVHLYPTGYLDRLLLLAEPKYLLGMSFGSFPYIVIPSDAETDFYISRFLVKMGLELLLFERDKVDPYASQFDAARMYARYGNHGMRWQMGYAVYPNKSDLVISTRFDEFGPLTTHQLYQCSMGRMLSGDFGICFVYRTHVFSCNLSSPSHIEYVSGFNRLNGFDMKLVTIMI